MIVEVTVESAKNGVESRIEIYGREIFGGKGAIVIGIVVVMGVEVVIGEDEGVFI